MATTKLSDRHQEHPKLRKIAHEVRVQNTYDMPHPDCYDISIKIFEALITNIGEITVNDLRVKQYNIPTGVGDEHTVHYVVELNQHHSKPIIIDASIDQFSEAYGHDDIAIGSRDKTGEIIVCSLSNYPFEEYRKIITGATSVKHPRIHSRYNLTVEFSVVPDTIPLNQTISLRPYTGDVADLHRANNHTKSVLADSKTPKGQYTFVKTVHEPTKMGPIYIIQSFRQPHKIYCKLIDSTAEQEKTHRLPVNSISCNKFEKPITWESESSPSHCSR